jgi:hypothetical protein
MNNSITLSAWVKSDDYNQFAKIVNKGQTGIGTPPDSGYSLRFVTSNYTSSGETELWFDFIDDGRTRAYSALPISQLAN